MVKITTLSSDRDWARDARPLLLEVVGSFELLEVLCALHAAAAPLPLATLVQQLAIGREAAVEATRRLRDARCAAEEPAGWRLDPAGPWAGAIDALAHGYVHDRIGVLNLMSETAMERIRSSAAQTFRDALRPKKPGGNG